jgi:hypothetical protein
MVARRVVCIKEIQKEIKDWVPVFTQPDLQSPGCQGVIRQFKDEADQALFRLHDYDPFFQTVWIFNSEGKVQDGIPEVRTFTHEQEATGVEIFSGEFALDRNIDAVAPQITRLAWGLAMVPAGEAARRPIRSPWVHVLKVPWSISGQMSEDQRLLLDMVGKPDPWILLARREGYTLAKPGEVRVTGCFGVMGVLTCPDLWKPCPAPAVGFDKPLPSGLQVAGAGQVLAVKFEDQNWTILQLRQDLHSLIEEGWEVLDAQVTPGREVFLLVQGTGMTRPNGGMGMCGAGTETDVVWIHISSSGRVRGKKAVWVDSCANIDKCKSYRYKPGNLAKGVEIVDIADD